MHRTADVRHAATSAASMPRTADAKIAVILVENMPRIADAMSAVSSAERAYSQGFNCRGRLTLPWGPQMAQDFYDRSGRATHYIDNNGTFYTWNGQPIGFVQGEELYATSGRHLGRVSSGWIRDHNGRAVAFSENASGGPLPPLRSLPSLKSLPSLPPLRGLPALPPLPALPSLTWSQYSIDDLFA